MMFWSKKFALVVSLLVVILLLLAACGAEEPTPASVEEVVDAEAEANADAEAETAAEADAGAEAEEPDAASGAASEEQIPMLRSEVPRISAEELKERIDNGETMVIGDTRSAYTYETSHITGSVSTPESDVLSQLEGIPLDQAIILYCS